MVETALLAKASLRPLDAAEKSCWLRLARSEGIGAVRFHRLLGRLGSAKAALAALPEMIAAGTAPGVRLCTADAAAAELAELPALGAVLLASAEPDYPAGLRATTDPPPALTVRGEVGALHGPAVAIVGARNASANGCRFAKALAADLAAAGLVVVSGLARGIDTAAHEGALAAGGRTVAVIASGVDVPYPAENADLARRIAQQGAVVSERPLGAAPQARHFPRRNRIIAGLALGVVVVEAAPGSGSLITARLAAEQGREVMAVPGSPLDPRHHGTNALLRDGAGLIQGAADVLELLRPLLGGPRRPAPRPRAAPATAPPQGAADGLPEQLAACLGAEPVALDELVRQSGASIAAVQQALLDLELSGRLERHPGNRVALRLD